MTTQHMTLKLSDLKWNPNDPWIKERLSVIELLWKRLAQSGKAKIKEDKP